MLAILGGTFDPVHFGHLRIALEICQQFPIRQFRFIPCRQPTLNKITVASAEQRLTMLKLAIQHEPRWVVDERELKRDTPSYTIETLISLRKEYPTTSLSLILGSDILNQLTAWHRWEELIHFAHLISVPRAETVLLPEKKLTAFIKCHETQEKQLLYKTLSGSFFKAETTALTISSAAIRQFIQRDLSPRYLLPEAVLSYIRKEKLYSIYS